MRIAGVQGLDQARQPCGRHRVDRPDAQGGGDRFRLLSQPGGEPVELGEHRLEGLQRLFAGLRQPERAVAALDQPAAQFVLERGDAGRDGRLAGGQFLGRPAEMARPGQDDEAAQVDAAHLQAATGTGGRPVLVAAHAGRIRMRSGAMPMRACPPGSSMTEAGASTLIF